MPLGEHTKCLGWRMRLPLRPPTTPMMEDGIFAVLMRAITKPNARDARNNAWILADTWRLIGEIFSVRWGQADTKPSFAA